LAEDNGKQFSPRDASPCVPESKERRLAVGFALELIHGGAFPNVCRRPATKAGLETGAPGAVSRYAPPPFAFRTKKPLLGEDELIEQIALSLR